MTTDIVSWDPTRPYVNRADAASDYWNAGCPLGYFAEMVPKGTVGSVDIGNPDAAVRCRSVESTTPQVLVEDASPYAVENMTRFNAALLDVMPSTTPWAMLAMIGVLVWYRMRGR